MFPIIIFVLCVREILISQVRLNKPQRKIESLLKKILSETMRIIF